MTGNHPLLDIVYRCGRSKYPLQGMYRRMQDKHLFLTAYGNIYANEGAMTAGTDPTQSIDGMSEARIDKLIASLTDHTFTWTPAKRVYIPKRRGGKRPIGIPNLNDKLVQEVIRMILEAYYEPQFRDSSYGFRPRRSCHTALETIVKKWNGTKWFIEGDIKGCFDHINHNYLMSLLARDIEDKRFLKLIRQMLRAGYMEEWREYPTFSGTPQGGIVSPILSNIVLHELDRYMEDEIIPAFNKGKLRRMGKAWSAHRRMYVYHKRRGNEEKARERQKMMRQVPSRDADDPDFKRVTYIRYADDFLIGVIGTKAEAQTIKDKVGAKLAEMHLHMSEEKSLITHARSAKAKFLGYEIGASADNRHMATRQCNGRSFRYRTGQSHIRLYVPHQVVRDWTRKYSQKGKAVPLTVRTHLSDFEIIDQYGSELRGLCNYYLPSHLVSKALSQVVYLGIQSAIKTLSLKHKTRAGAMWRKYWTATPTGKKGLYIETPHPDKPNKVFKAMCGEVRLIGATFHEKVYDRHWMPQYDSNELVRRLTADQCELCGATGKCVAHHIQKLKDLEHRWAGRKDKPNWVKLMIQRRRKTLIVCKLCHQRIHSGTYDGKAVRQS